MRAMRINYNFLNSNMERRILRNVPEYYDTSKESLKKSKLCSKSGKEVSQHRSI